MRTKKVKKLSIGDKIKIEVEGIVIGKDSDCSYDPRIKIFLTCETLSPWVLDKNILSKISPDEE